MISRLVCIVALGLVLGSVSVAVAAFDPNTDASLLGHWTFNEGTGTTAADSSGNGVTGTLNGGATWVPGVSGVWGSGVQFDGVNGYVDTGNTEDLAKWTLSVWVMSPAAPGSTSPTGPVHRESNYQINWNHGDAVFRGAAALNVGGTWSAASFGAMEANTWYHLVATYDGETLSAYKDNVLVTANTAPSGNPNAETNSLKFGRHAASAQYMAGTVDEIHIFKRALTADEVKAFPKRPLILKARKPVPAVGEVLAGGLLSWTKGETAARHNVYLGLTPELTAADKITPTAITKVTLIPPVLTPGATYYWRVDELDSKGTLIATGDVWSFMMEPLAAYTPSPADGSAGIFPGTALSWTIPSTSMGQHLYFSSVQSEVATGAAAADKGAPELGSFNTGVLRSSTTYYWRVDEATLDPDTGEEVVVPSPVWSFETADAIGKKVVRQWWSGIGGTAVTDLTGNAAYPNSPTGTEMLETFEGPTDWADNYGTRMHGWLTPPQTGDYTFWIASDDSSQLSLSTDMDPANATVIASVSGYTGSLEWAKYASQKSAAITLQAGQKYFIEALQKEGGGGDNLAVSWQGGSITGQTILSAQYIDTFALPALQAYAPSPANRDVNTPYDGALSWTAGEGAQKHNVYFGTDANAVATADAASPLYKGQQTGTTFEAGALEWGKTYYWRIDEVGATGTLTGNVWSFTTRNFLLVDDMESYTGEVGNEIFSVWLDNYETGAAVQKGATVGYEDSPYVETRAAYIHGGKQSMPLRYDNTGPKYLFSQTVQEVAEGDWTVNGVTDLSLWVRGYADVNNITVTEAAGGKITLTADGRDIWDDYDQFVFAYKTLTGDGSMIARVTSVGTGTNTWAKAGVMIRDSLDGGSMFFNMVMTGGASTGASSQYRLITNGNCNNAGEGGATDAVATVAPPYWVKVERLGDNLNSYIASDGKTWVPVSTQTIVMNAPVYIGLCATSHAAGQNRTMEFDSITATGGVSGSWQGAQLANAYSNTPTGLYVTVEDTTGKKATQSNATAVNSAAFAQVKFPLSGFTGVSLGKVKRLYISVGDPKTTVPGGTGMIYLDDIQVTKP